MSQEELYIKYAQEACTPLQQHTQPTFTFNQHPSVFEYRPMSEYSTPSTTSDLSEFSNPPARRYRLHNMSPPQRMSLVWHPHPSSNTVFKNADVDPGGETRDYLSPPATPHQHPSLASQSRTRLRRVEHARRRRAYDCGMDILCLVAWSAD